MRVPARMAAAYSYTSEKAFVPSLASFTFSIGLPSFARSIVSVGRKEVPVTVLSAVSVITRPRSRRTGELNEAEKTRTSCSAEVACSAATQAKHVVYFIVSWVPGVGERL